MSKGNLKTHIQSKHEGISYICDHCDYKATTKFYLKEHVQSKHKGISYNCDQCEFKATTKSYLKEHVQSKHEGISYACEHCEYIDKSISIFDNGDCHEGCVYLLLPSRLFDLCAIIRGMQ